MLVWIIAVSIVGQVDGVQQQPPKREVKPLPGGEPIDDLNPTSTPWFPTTTLDGLRITVTGGLDFFPSGDRRDRSLIYVFLEFSNSKKDESVPFRWDMAAPPPTLKTQDGREFRMNGSPFSQTKDKINPEHIATGVVEFSGPSADKTELILAIPGAVLGKQKDVLVRIPPRFFRRDHKGELYDWKRTRETTSIDVLNFGSPAKAFIRLQPSKLTRYVSAGDFVGNFTVAKVDQATDVVELKDVAGKSTRFKASKGETR